SSLCSRPLLHLYTLPLPHPFPISLPHGRTTGVSLLAELPAGRAEVLTLRQRQYHRQAFAPQRALPFDGIVAAARVGPRHVPLAEIGKGPVSTSVTCQYRMPASVFK